MGDLPDAGSAEDAGVDAVMRGTVHVTVLDWSGTAAPAAGASVVFIDPDGTLVKRAATDTSGKAEADVLPGASVTVVALQNTAYEIQTVLAVQPGDDLILGGSRGRSRKTLGSFTVWFPAHPSAASYTVAGPCFPVNAVPYYPGWTPPTTAMMWIYDDCKLDPMEIEVIAYDASSNPIGVFNQTGVPFVANGSTTLTGSYQPPLNFIASYTNINPAVTTMWMSRAVPDYFALGSVSAAASPPTATQVLTLPGAVGSRALVTTEVGNASHARQIVSQYVSGRDASYGLDLNATLLPWLGKPTFDAASERILVPADTTGTTTATPDAVSLTASYRRTDPASGAMTTFSWTLFSPVVADVTLPNLPLEVGDIMPTAADAVKVFVYILETDAVASFDAIRHDLNGALLQSSGLRPPGTMQRVEFAPDPFYGQ